MAEPEILSPNFQIPNGARNVDASGNASSAWERFAAKAGDLKDKAGEYINKGRQGARNFASNARDAWNNWGNSNGSGGGSGGGQPTPSTDPNQLRLGSGSEPPVGEASPGWGSKAWQSVKNVFTRGGGSAAGDAAATGAGEEVATTGAKYGLGMIVKGAAGGAIGGALPGVIETGIGVYQHDGVKTTKGVLGTAMGAGGAIAGAEAGLATGAAIGLIFPPAEVITAPLGFVGGAIVGSLGFLGANKGVDAAVNLYHKVTHSAGETRDQARAHWSEYDKIFHDKLKAAESATKENAQAALNEAGAARDKLAAYFNDMEKKGFMSKDEVAKGNENAQFDLKHTFDDMTRKFAAGLASAGAAIKEALTPKSVEAAERHPGAGGHHHAGGAAGGATHHAGAAAGASAPHHDAGLEADVKALQELIGAKKMVNGQLVDDRDGLLGHGVRDKLVELGVLKEGELSLPPHGVASDAQLRDFFSKHTPDEIKAKVDAANGVTAEAPAVVTSPEAPASAAPAKKQEEPAPPPPETPQYQIANDAKLQAALSSLNVHDMEEMHPGRGPLHVGTLVDARRMREIGVIVENENDPNTGRQYNDKKLPYIANIPTPEGQTPVTTRLGTIDIPAEGSGQRYQVRDTNGIDVTDSVAPVSQQAIQQAAREHIGHINIEQVNDGHTFVFAPVKAPSADKGVETLPSK